MGALRSKRRYLISTFLKNNSFLIKNQLLKPLGSIGTKELDPGNGRLLLRLIRSEPIRQNVVIIDGFLFILLGLWVGLPLLYAGHLIQSDACTLLLDSGQIDALLSKGFSFSGLELRFVDLIFVLFLFSCVIAETLNSLHLLVRIK